MTATTFEVFDLLEGSGTRQSLRASVVSDGNSGPLFSRQKNSRQVRSYSFVIRNASFLEVRRLNNLWNLTAGGLLPMLWNHPEDGNVAVVFDMEQLVWRQDTKVSASIELQLREFLG